MLHSFLGMMAEAKQAKYSCKFTTDLKKTFSFVRECPSSVKDSVHKFHCTICNVNMSLAHGGKSDIKQHYVDANTLRSVYFGIFSSTM